MKNAFLTLIFLLTNSLFAQVQFEAKVKQDSYAQNEKIELIYSMNIDADNFAIPSMDAFYVQGPIIFIQGIKINGKKALYKEYKFYLEPKRKGDFNIPAAQIEFNGKYYKSNAVKIKVTKPIEVQQPSNFDNYKLGEGVFLVAEVSNKNPYVNEPIRVVYKLYYDQEVRIADIPNKKPTFNGFWNQFFDSKNYQSFEAIYKGKNYAMVVLGNAILYPLESGLKKIEPFNFNIKIETPTNMIDVFGEPIYTIKQKSVATDALAINVKALPEAGKPDDFSGAVGEFGFAANPSKITLKNGEPLNLNLKIYGNGNLKLFSIPKPELPSELEIYDPEHQENVATQLNGMNGSISDTYAIIPQYKGNYTIKPIKFSYFDLKTKSYKTIQSKEISFTVLDGPNASNAIAKNAKKDANKKNITRKTFAFIKTKTSLSSIKSGDFMGSGLFYSLVFLPFLLIPALVVFKKKKEASSADVVGNKKKKSNALAKKYLFEAQKQINNKEPFYIALEKAMHNFLKAKLSIETSEMSKDKITELLLSKNANSETVSNFINLTENCEIARYAPSTNVTIQQDYDKAVEIISSLEKQIH